MEPKQHKTRTPNPGGQTLNVADVNDSPDDLFNDFFENGDMGFVEDDDKYTNEERRIESLKRAIDIAKLMSNVTVDDIINIATTVDKYIQAEI